jgi:N-sulfoglucosamine sulfohydrolase
MRELFEKNELTGPALALMHPMPYELLYNTEADPHEIDNLVESNEQEDQAALFRMRAAMDTWEVETGDLGIWPEPDDVVRPFEKEMDEWFGTPEWYKKID